MSKIVSLKPNDTDGKFEVEVNTDTVKCLEEWLEKAKEGKLDGIAIAGAIRNGEIMTSFTKTNNYHQITAALAILQHRRLETRISIDTWED